MQNIIYKTVIVLTILITGVIGPSISSAEESGRPTNLPLESFQFGPRQSLDVQSYERNNPNG